MTWHEGPMYGFDLETTGVNPEEARIVTAAVAICGPNVETVTETWLADPGIEIPDGAAEVHGITTAHAREHGQSARDVVGEVLEFLGGRQPGVPLVIFNARYDLTVLDREARRHGLAPLSQDGVVDPLVIDKHLHRYRRGSRKLDAQAEHYGARLDNAHDAGADAIAACRVAWCIGQRGQIIRRARNAIEDQQLARLEAEWATVRNDLEALHQAQARWAREQAESLEQYFRSQGKNEHVHRDWPVIPWTEPMAAAA